MDLKFDIYDSFDIKLETEWCQLESKCDHFIFQSYAWLSHWHRTIGLYTYDVTPVVVVVKSSSSTVAIFPFGIRNNFSTKVLEFLGGAQSDYNSILVLPGFFKDKELKILWNKLLEKLPDHDLRCFVRMPMIVSGLRNPIIYDEPSLCEGVSYAASLPVSWEMFQERLPKRYKKDNARMIRRLSEIGTIKFVVASNHDEYSSILTKMFQQKQRRYKETGAMNILSDVNTRVFYRGLETIANGSANVHLSALMLNGEVLATHLGAYDTKRFYYLLPTFANGEWSKFSPGRLLLDYLVQWSIEHRLKNFDFTIGAESYKEKWCDSELPVYRLMSPLSFRGRVYVSIQLFIYWIKTNPRPRAFAMNLVRVANKFRIN